MIIIHLYHNALALLDLYSQVSLSLNPTPSRLRVREMEVIPPTLTVHAVAMAGHCVQCPSQWGK